MKLIPLFIFLLPISVLAQKSRIEIGVVGGIHIHSVPTNVFIVPGSSTVKFVSPAGGLLLRYVVAQKWKIGLSFNALEASYLRLKDLSPTIDTKVYFGAPLITTCATITRVIHDQKWQSAITVQGGFVKSFEKNVPDNSNPDPFLPVGTNSKNFVIAYPPGTGFTLGLSLEQSRIFYKNAGFLASIGFNYYNVSWSGSTSTSNLIYKEGEGNFISFPIQIGAFLKF